MRKIIFVIFISLFVGIDANAGADGENSLSSKNDPSNVKDCFEGVNRAVFGFNQGLDTAVFEPVAKAYRKLPKPIRKGTGNFVLNLSNLATIPNNILQGDLKMAATNTGRLVVNTTVGILGIFDPAASRIISVSPSAFACRVMITLPDMFSDVGLIDTSSV